MPPPKETSKFTNVNISHRIQQQELRSLNTIPLQSNQGKLHIVKSKSSGESVVKSPQVFAPKSWDFPKVQPEDDKENIPMQGAVKQGANISNRDDDTKWGEEEGEMDFSAPLPGMDANLPQSVCTTHPAACIGSSSITTCNSMPPQTMPPSVEACSNPTQDLHGTSITTEKRQDSPKHASYVPPHMRARIQKSEACPPLEKETPRDPSPNGREGSGSDAQLPKHAHLPFGAVVAGPCTLHSVKERSQATIPGEKSPEPSHPTFKLLLRPKPPAQVEQVLSTGNLQSTSAPDNSKSSPCREFTPERIQKAASDFTPESHSQEDEDDSWYWEQNVQQERATKGWTANTPGKGSRAQDKCDREMTAGSGIGHHPTHGHQNVQREGRDLPDQTSKRRGKEAAPASRNRHRQDNTEIHHPADQWHRDHPLDRGFCDASHDNRDGQRVRRRNNAKGARRWVCEVERPHKGHASQSVEPHMDEYGYEQGGPLKADLEADRQRQRTGVRGGRHEHEWDEWAGCADHHRHGGRRGPPTAVRRATGEDEDESFGTSRGQAWQDPPKGHSARQQGGKGDQGGSNRQRGGKGKGQRYVPKA
eukprot:GGOE01006127.1.p1 GENE.GGOE01006127.1~~GGOE01006127.1.p1  ORF type:complete len:589 (-),score=32.13 GGOE01006127.1:308-2074(-)